MNYYSWVIFAPFGQSECDMINTMADDSFVSVNLDPDGWIDGTTGYKLITDCHKISLMFSDEKYNTAILLKFGDRARLESVCYNSN